MTDTQHRTQWAVDLFVEFVKQWTPPVMRTQILNVRTFRMNESLPGERVIRAIKAIAPPVDDSQQHIGWAVFKQEHDHQYRREWPSGFTHTMVGVVFETMTQVGNVLENRKTKDPKGEYFICEIRRIT